MARKQHNIHYIYKTTCNITKRYYVGMHSTTNLEDGYLGSGKRLRYSIRKYGKENHTKEILEFLPTRDELIVRESEIINQEMLNDCLCMNLMNGGQGGFISEEQQKYRSKCANIKLNEKLQNDETFRNLWRTNLINGVKKSYSDGKKDKKWGKNWLGLKHTEKTIEKMRESHKNQGRGINNSQYGTCWITNEIINKKIYKGDLIPEGWRLGRVFNK
jgi:hypothetical protein